jgi:hypothetical protein
MVIKAYERVASDPANGIAFRLVGTSAAIDSVWDALARGALLFRTIIAIDGVSVVRLHPQPLSAASRQSGTPQVTFVALPAPRSAADALKDAYNASLQQYHDEIVATSKYLVRSGCSDSYELRDSSDPGYCLKRFVIKPSDNPECDYSQNKYVTCADLADCRFGNGKGALQPPHWFGDLGLSVESANSGKNPHYGSVCECVVRCNNQSTGLKMAPEPALELVPVVN